MAGRYSNRYNRRNALIGAGRWALAAAAVTVGAFGVAKRGRLQAQGVCTNQGLCDGCEAVGACRLPRADRYRASTGGPLRND